MVNKNGQFGTEVMPIFLVITKNLGLMIFIVISHNIDLINKIEKLLEKSGYCTQKISDTNIPKARYIGITGPHFGRLPVAYRLTTRNDGIWVWNKHIECAMTLKKHHAQNDPRIVIVRPVGDTLLPTAIVHMAEILKELNQTIVVKSVLPDLGNQLEQYGFTTYRKGDSWDNFAIEDDQTYPEHIVSTQAIKTRYGKRFKRLRRCLSKAKKFDLSWDSIYAETHAHKISVNGYSTSLITEWVNGYIRRYPTANKENIRSFYDAWINSMTLSDPKHIVCVVHRNKEDFLGLSFFGLIEDDTAEAYVMLLSRHIPYIGYVTLTKSLLALLDTYGIKKVNLGGSETKGLDFFKRTFVPEKSLDVKHRIYYGTK